MPRRRKKKEDCQLPPLQFVESPLNQSPKDTSPEFGAFNPITVPVVSVGDIHDLSWVTPHFDKRLTYSKHGMIETSKGKNSRKKSETNTFHRNLCNVVSKYNPLLFVQDNEYNKSSRFKRHSRKNNENKHLPSVQNLIVTDHIVTNIETPPSVTISTPVLDSNERDIYMNLSTSGHALISRCADNEVLNVNNHQNVTKTKTISDSMHRSGEVCHGQNIKSRKLFPLFDDSSTPPQSPVFKVLVANTPECEYGMTMRQRQMKYWLRSGQQR